MVLKYSSGIGMYTGMERNPFINIAMKVHNSLGIGIALCPSIGIGIGTWVLMED